MGIDDIIDGKIARLHPVKGANFKPERFVKPPSGRIVKIDGVNLDYRNPKH